MEVLRRRFESLATCLLKLGYKFQQPTSVVGSPDSELEHKLAIIEREVSPMPRALVSFYATIGSLNFLGGHPDWVNCDYPDPVFVDSIDAVLVELTAWKEQIEDIGPAEAGPFLVPIAPDFYHKENVSGGMWYNVELPAELDDPQISDEWHQTTFASYLNICLKWGGFPGLERSPGHTWPLDELRAASA